MYMHMYNVYVNYPSLVLHTKFGQQVEMLCLELCYFVHVCVIWPSQLSCLWQSICLVRRVS